jgi:hypothetical protein
MVQRPDVPRAREARRRHRGSGHPVPVRVKLARELHGRLLTFEGNQHTASLGGVGCVDQAMSAYLSSLTLPPEGLRCAP